MINIQVNAFITIVPERIQDIIDNPSGPVGQKAQRYAEQALDIAKNNIGTRYSGHHREGAQARDRLLKESGRVIPGRQGRGASRVLIFEHPIAFLHHEGAQPHGMPQKFLDDIPSVYIRRGPGGYRFGPTRGPINHPGTDSNPYIRNAAIQLGLKPSGALKRGQRIGPVFRVPQGFA